MQIRAIADVDAVPWKNGGGETRTLLVSPPFATLTDFDWRISIASIQKPGPFSSFPGIDRTLLLWEGDVLTLQWAGGSTTLDKVLASVSFDGERAVESFLPGGATCDVNVMTARDRCVARCTSTRREMFLNASQHTTHVVLCKRGIIAVSSREDRVEMAAEHFAAADSGDAMSVVPITDDALYLCVTISRIVASNA